MSFAAQASATPLARLLSPPRGSSRGMTWQSTTRVLGRASTASASAVYKGRSSGSGSGNAGVTRAQVETSSDYAVAHPVEVADAIALCNRRIEVLGTDLYKVTQEVTDAVDVMVATKSLGGDGVWEVFHAPHMARMSNPVGVNFKPVRYVVSGNQIRSDVHFSGPGGVNGWLCSAGVVRASSDDAVEIVFDSFWTAENGGSPRDNPVAKDVAKAGDRIVNSIGRLAFLSSFAVFPVHFFDRDAGICIFEFPPLNSYIAAKLVGPVPVDITF